MDLASVDEAELRRRYTSLLPLCREVKNRLVSDLESFLDDVEYVDIVIGRVKGKDSFVAKVMSDPTKYDPPFQVVEDLIALRVLVLFSDIAERVYNRIAKDFQPNVEDRFKAPLTPNEFGYEGYHLIQSIPLDYVSVFPESGDVPCVFEIQVKTLFMHAWAEPEHLIRYKRTKGAESLPKDVERKLAWIAASAWGADSVMIQLKDWLES